MSDAPLPPPAGEPAASGTHPARPRHAPNYLVRRAIAVGVVIAVVAVIATVVGWVLARDDGGHDPVAVETGWDVIVAIDPVTGVVTVTDPDTGDVIEEIETDVGRVEDSMLVDSTLIVVGARGLAGVDISHSNAAVDLDPDDTLGDSVTIVRPEGSDQTALLDDGEGNIVVVHQRPDDAVATATLIELRGVRLDTVGALATPDGRAVLLRDTGNFQSVLVGVDGDEPVYFPGAPIAVDDDRVATVQNVGAEARVTIASHDGETTAEFVAEPIAEAMLVDDGLLMVSTAGELWSGTDDTTERVGNVSGIPVAARSFIMISGDRLVVSTDLATDVVDPTGETVATVVGAAAIVDDPRPWSPGMHHALCIAADVEGDVVLVDTRTPAQSAPGPYEEALVRADGCAGIRLADDAEFAIDVETAGDGQRLDLGTEPIALSPDGETVAIEDGASIVLVAVPSGTSDASEDGEDADEPTEVAERGAIVYFAST